eukprot:TRINITY_DN4069_c0_g1_i1.p1 TRINITY_DN4069_c0_g1~~TRINITY_DN4069_c0_g1_i1.p1  ORF type:complete len:344 (-),score=103.33 TRINITY_DN4069_c0_g1_i1:37-1011(-)
MKAGPDKNRYKDYQSEVREVARQLRQSTRTLVKSLKEDPELPSRLQDTHAERSPELQVLGKTLQALQDMTFMRLATTVEEEKSRLDFTSQIISKEKKASAERLKLEQELAVAKREREGEASQRQSTISKLREEVAAVRAQSAIDHKGLLREAKSREGADLKSFQEKVVTLTQDRSRLTATKAEVTKANLETEASLRKMKVRVEQEVVNWINKYDSDMEEKHSMLTTLQGIHEEEVAQLEDLEKKYEELSKERDAIMEKKQAVMMKEAQQQAYFWKLSQAATAIQAVFRGYSERKKLAKKKRKGRKKSSSPRRTRPSTTSTNRTR